MVLHHQKMGFQTHPIPTECPEPVQTQQNANIDPFELLQRERLGLTPEKSGPDMKIPIPVF